MLKPTNLALAALLSVTSVAAAGSDTQWLHVAVDGEDDERVRINVPLNLVSAVLPLIEDDDFHHGRIVLDGEEFDRDDLVAMLAAVAEAEDGEYVTVDDRDDHVRISKQGDTILVKVEEKRRRTGEVETEVVVRIPVAVLDALASGDSNELNVVAAVEALGKYAENGDLVTVNDDEDVVRIWIDGKNESD